MTSAGARPSVSLDHLHGSCAGDWTCSGSWMSSFRLRWPAHRCRKILLLCGLARNGRAKLLLSRIRWTTSRWKTAIHRPLHERPASATRAGGTPNPMEPALPDAARSEPRPPGRPRNNRKFLHPLHTSSEDAPGTDTCHGEPVVRPPRRHLTHATSRGLRGTTR